MTADALAPCIPALLEPLHRGHGREREQHGGDDSTPALGQSTFTARAMTRPTTASEISDWSDIVSFAHTATGMTSVGLNAVLVVSPRTR